VLIEIPIKNDDYNAYIYANRVCFNRQVLEYYNREWIGINVIPCLDIDALKIFSIER